MTTPPRTAPVRVRWNAYAVAAIASGLIWACATGLAFAQGSGAKSKAGGAAGGHGGGSGAGSAPRPGGGHGGGGGAGMGGFAPGGKKAATKGTPTPRTTAPAAPPEPVDPATGIPLTFQPKKDSPDLMGLDQPLVSEETLAKWKRQVGAYRTALRNGDLSAKGKALIIDGIKYRMAMMAVKDEQQKLAYNREELTVRELPGAGQLLNKDTQVREFRRWVMEEVVKEVKPLLQNNYYVRVHAATLLGELNLTEISDKHKLTLETYTPAVDLLREVLRDPEQPLPVKIAAARSMVRLIRFGLLPANKRFDTTKDVLAELNLPPEKTHFWYQMRLVELLSTLDTPVDLETRKPTIVLALSNILNDPNMDWHVRAEAARALGRTPLDPQVNISGIMQDLMQLALEMAKKAQQQPKAPQWKMTFFKLYLAFQALDANDRDAAKKGKAGLLNNASASSAARTPYDLVVPVVNAVINDQPITADQVKALDDWVTKNRPRSSTASGGTATPQAAASSATSSNGQ